MCSAGNWITLDGRTISSGGGVVVPRQKYHHRQLVELTCGKSTFLSSISKKYLLSIFSNFEKNDIARPRLVVNGRGKDCMFNADEQTFKCPNPRAKDYRIRLIGFVEPSIRYTVESDDQSVSWWCPL